MAETDIKFGPEWIRALSQSGGNSGSGTIHHSSSSPPSSPNGGGGAPKYKMAKYRYGREEMLCLFNSNVKMSDDLKEFSHLTVQEIQQPLALINIDETERQLLSRNVNSDLALRAASKAGGTNNSGTNPTRGRGAIDRGRGRGRGTYYQRSYEDGEEMGSFRSSGRMNSDRQSDQRWERERQSSLSERDQRWGNEDRRYPPRSFTGGRSSQEEGTNRKEGGPPSDNWRRSGTKDSSERKEEENNGWRSSRSGDKWGSSSGGRGGNWRSQDRGDRSKDDPPDDPSRPSSLQNGPKSFQKSRSSHHSSSWDEPDKEWSMEESKNAERTGTFDSTGAFRESKESYSSDDDYTSDQESPEVRGSSGDPSVNKLSTADEDSLKNSKGPKNSPSKPVPISRSQSQNNSHQPSSCSSSANMSPASLGASPSCHYLRPPDMGTPNTPHLSSSSNSSPLVAALKKCTSAVVTTASPANANPSPVTEEDTFAQLQKATESMMARWSAEEDHHDPSSLQAPPPPLPLDKKSPLPPHHEDAYKWFYSDPQGEIQGPFTSEEMFDWFKAGVYFGLNLPVRRGCDEIFTTIGDLAKAWGELPFKVDVKSMPPIRNPTTLPVASAPLPMVPPGTNQPPPPPPNLVKPMDYHMKFYQHQSFLDYRLLQQQIAFRDAQISQIHNQLKQQESFNNLPPAQQNALVLQHLQRQAEGINPLAFLSLNNLNKAPIPPQTTASTSPTSTPLADPSLWGIAPGLAGAPANSWVAPPPIPVPQPGADQPLLPTIPPTALPSMWDLDPKLLAAAREEAEKKKQEEEEERKKLEEERKKIEEERLLLEEQNRKQEEERKKQEEERRRLEELKRKQEEEQRQLEEHRRKVQMEEERRRKEDERRLEELRKLEEERKLEERRKLEYQRLEEIRKQKERERLENERKRKEEEERLLQEQKKKEEAEKVKQRTEEARKQKAQKKLEKERRKQEELERLQKEKEVEEKRRKELEEAEKHQRELELKIQQEKERERELQQQKKQQQTSASLIKPQSQGEQQKPKQQTMGAWGNNIATPTPPSLAEIQKAQEEKEVKQRQQQRQQQQQQQQPPQQAAPGKPHLTWAQKPVFLHQQSAKSLAEIQQEEQERLAVLQQKQAKQKPAMNPVALANLGAWKNASTHFSSKNSMAAPFWEDDVPAPSTKNVVTSAFPTLGGKSSEHSHLGNAANSKGKGTKGGAQNRSKKAEESVMKLFHVDAIDDFTQWCSTQLQRHLSNVDHNNIDIPTFISLIKDVESPLEVNEYVKSYFGDSREIQDFINQFLEKRSKQQQHASSQKPSPPPPQQAKKNTPISKPSTTTTTTNNKKPSSNHVPPSPQPQHSVANTTPGGNKTKAGGKKKNRKMQKVDNSLLGFTVQPDPDRINVGEIDHVEGY